MLYRDIVSVTWKNIALNIAREKEPAIKNRFYTRNKRPDVNDGEARNLKY